MQTTTTRSRRFSKREKALANSGITQRVGEGPPSHTRRVETNDRHQVDEDGPVTHDYGFEGLSPFPGVLSGLAHRNRRPPMSKPEHTPTDRRTKHDHRHAHHGYETNPECDYPGYTETDSTNRIRILVDGTGESQMACPTHRKELMGVSS